MALEVYRIDEIINNKELSDKLNEFALLSTNLYRMYATIDWIKCLNVSDTETLILTQLSDNSEIENLLPFRKCIKKLNIASYKSINLTSNLMSADAIGCEPMGIVSEVNYSKLLNGLFDRYQDISCIYFKSIAPDSQIFNCLVRSADIPTAKYFCCLESGPRDFHTLSLKVTFNEYLALFNKKERYNLKRQCRLAQEASGGELTLKRITSPQEVDYLASCARQILNNSWKSNMGEIEQFFSEERCLEYCSFARNGLLRSYVLLGNDEPWAFVLGYQWDGVFHYSNVAYKQSMANLSPGTVLFYLMLEDLHLHNKPQIINFGVGNSFYKRRFGTDCSKDCTLLVLRNGLKNMALSVCINLVNHAKRILKNTKIFGTEQIV
jgi:hypothetical protein